jgi:transcriptional regulator with PAS, ATPase and Fis domain
VRELELMARRLLAVHGTEPVLRVTHAVDVGQLATSARSRSVRRQKCLSETRFGFRDRRQSDLHRLNDALIHTDGNLKAAAESIGISRRRAYRLIDSIKPSGDSS